MIENSILHPDLFCFVAAWRRLSAFTLGGWPCQDVGDDVAMHIGEAEVAAYSYISPVFNKNSSWLPLDKNFGFAKNELDDGQGASIQSCAISEISPALSPNDPRSIPNRCAILSKRSFIGLSSL